jgi:hypothetical protein
MEDQLATQLVDRLARIETKLDHSNERFASQESRLVQLEARVPDPDHESRIRKLERMVWTVAGVAAAGGGILGNILSHVTGS